MSKSSLEMCTESLGSETGSGDFSDDDQGWLNSFADNEEAVVKLKMRQQQLGDGIQLMSVNYHCSVSRRATTPRFYPPPLPSISCLDGTCIQMRSHRYNSRLIVDAVPVSSQNYLHARRQDGRLLISFVDSTTISQHTADKATQEPPLKEEDQSIEHTVPPFKEINQSLEEVGDEEEDEEEVEVLDRGSMIEGKVSRLPDRIKKVLRSSIVINKFVGGTPLTNQNRRAEQAERNDHSNPLTASKPPPPQHRLTAYINHQHQHCCGGNRRAEQAERNDHSNPLTASKPPPPQHQLTAYINHQHQHCRGGSCGCFLDKHLLPNGRTAAAFGG